MSRPPITIRPNEDISAAIKLVTERGIGCVPVVERGRLDDDPQADDALEERLELVDPATNVRLQRGARHHHHLEECDLGLASAWLGSALARSCPFGRRA